MKKIITIFFLLFFFKPIFGLAYPKSFNAILPSNATYQADLSKAKTTQADEFLKKVQGKFYTTKSIYHVFLSNSVYKDVLKQFKEKGVLLKRLAKKKKIAELELQKSAKLKPLIDLLKDPNYHESVGIHQGWLIQVYSSATLAGKKINQVTIVLTKSVPKKEEQKEPSKPTLPTQKGR